MRVKASISPRKKNHKNGRYSRDDADASFEEVAERRIWSGLELSTMVPHNKGGQGMYSDTAKYF